MSEEALRIVLDHSAKGREVREKFFAEHGRKVVEVARLLAVCLARGGKILLCGNGGSAADAQHVAGELVNRFLLERPPLPAVALTTDTSVLTAIGNDYGFEQIFSKQVQALGKPGDVLVAISTSGNSANVNLALRAAREKGLTTVGLGGRSGGEMLPFCDHALLVDAESTPLIQEVHLAVEHLLCQLVDYYLFEAVMELTPYLDQGA